MRFLTFFFMLSICFAISCGNEDSFKSKETVAFLNSDLTTYSEMNLKGKDVSEITYDSEQSTYWGYRDSIINQVCGENYGALLPIFVFTPDGAEIGRLDDSWEPSFSPDGTKVAFACGLDDAGNVVVVSNTEGSGSTVSNDIWSRTGEAVLSDRMEIVVVATDGSSLLRLTNNDSGDWLPRWFPTDRYSKKSWVTNDFLSEEPLLVESNRNGKSEIFILSTTSTKKWRVSDNFDLAQSPAWSQNGNAIAFATGDPQSSTEIVIAFDTKETSIIETGVKGRPVPWLGE